MVRLVCLIEIQAAWRYIEPWLGLLYDVLLLIVIRDLCYTYRVYYEVYFKVEPLPHGRDSLCKYVGARRLERRAPALNLLW